MEGKHTPIIKFTSKPGSTTSAAPATVSSSQRVIILTPIEASKYGITQKLNKGAVIPQEKKGLKVSKITIVNSPKNVKTTEAIVKSKVSANTTSEVMKAKLLNLLNASPPTILNAGVSSSVVKPDSLVRTTKSETSKVPSLKPLPKFQDEVIVLKDEPKIPPEKPKITILNFVKPIPLDPSLHIETSVPKKANLVKESTAIQESQKQKISFDLLSNVESTISRRPNVVNEAIVIQDSPKQKISVDSLTDIETTISKKPNAVTENVVQESHNRKISLDSLDIEAFISKKPVESQEQKIMVDSSALDIEATIPNTVNIVKESTGVQENQKQKIQVLSNKQISLSSECIKELLKGTSSEKQLTTPSYLNITNKDDEEVQIISLNNEADEDESDKSKEQLNKEKMFVLISNSEVSVTRDDEEEQDREEIIDLTQSENNIKSQNKPIMRIVGTSKLTKPNVVQNSIQAKFQQNTIRSKLYSSPLIRTYSRKVSSLDAVNKESTEMYKKRKSLLIASSIKDMALHTPSSKKIEQKDDEEVIITLIKDDSNGVERYQKVEAVVIKDDVTTKPAPKKRGRKPKSEMDKIQQQNKVTEKRENKISMEAQQVEMSKRGRKRKVIDYSVLAGESDGDEDDYADKTVSDQNTDNENIFDVDDNDLREFKELTPKPKKKVGRPRKYSVETTSSTAENANLDNNIKGEGEESCLKEEPKDFDESGNDSSTEVKIKRPRGRPRKSGSVLLNTMLSLINTTQQNTLNSNSKGESMMPVKAESDVNDLKALKNEAEATTENENINQSDMENLISTNVIEIVHNDVDKTKSCDDDASEQNVSGDTNTSMEVTNEASLKEIVVKKGRGRKRKPENLTIERSSGSVDMALNTETGNEEEMRSEENDSDVDVNPNLTFDKNLPQSTPAKRGRKRKDTNTIPDGSITCGVCNVQMCKTTWPNHKLRFHNNLAWREGETPLNLRDEQLVLKILSDIYRKKKPFYCELCDTKKKSVIGYLSHKAVCQKSTEEISALRVKCEHCGKGVMPISMAAHMNYCKKANSKSDDDAEDDTAPNDSAVAVEGKRQAAKKAVDLIKSIREEGPSEKPVKSTPVASSRVLLRNYDFKPNFFSRRHFNVTIRKDGSVKCRFEGCEFITSDVEEILNHLYGCEKKPAEGYTCKYCIRIYKTQNEALGHVMKVHRSSAKEADNNDESDNNNDEEEESEEYEASEEEVNMDEALIKQPVNRPALLHGIKFLLKNRYCFSSENVIYPPALQWMLKFSKENYSDPNLFQNWRMKLQNWKTLDPLYFSNYLPQSKYSACTAKIRTSKIVNPLECDHKWKRYKLFESSLSDDDVATFFCGGPVFAMAWLPTPDNLKECDQILAVCANSDADKEYSLGKSYSEPGLVQFWNCGKLLNSIKDAPKLEFCIAHNHAPVWCLEWCPSGCYDALQPGSEFLQRLGLLAVASTDSCVYLYSVCLPIENCGKIMQTQPVVKLIVEPLVEHTVNNLKAHATRISWSKSKGHQHVLVGYANGVIGIFDLNTDSQLLRSKDKDGIEIILAYRTFVAHDRPVTALSLYHLNNGRRWIMSGSIDRTIKCWDLENLAVPLSTFEKNIVTDGVWPIHWLCNLIGFDDSYTGGSTASALYQLRNYESGFISVMQSSSSITSITRSDWANGFVQSSNTGELMGFFPHQIFYNIDSDKSLRNKKSILGYTRLIPKTFQRLEEKRKVPDKKKNKSKKAAATKQTSLSDCAELDSSTYREAEEKYGLVFCDLTIDSIKQFPSISEKYKHGKGHGTPSFNSYPLQSINKVVMNQNRHSCMFLAAGYQAGFVRISKLDFLDKSRLFIDG